MATTGPELEIDALTQLEERVQKAVALVQRLRQEKDALQKDLAASQSALEDSQIANLTLKEELDTMQAERKQVRGRLEKLLGHIDQLGAA